VNWQHNNRVSGYSLSDLSRWSFILVLVCGFFMWISKGFILTYFSALILIIILHQLMKSRQLSYLYKLPIFIFVTVGLLQRTFFLIGDPGGYAFDFSMDLTDGVLAAVLSYVAIILFFLLCFLGLQYYFSKGRLPSFVRLPRATSTRLLKVAVGYYFLSLVVNIYLGIVYHVAMQGGERSSLGFLTRIFDVEQAPLIVMFLYVYCRDILTKSQRNLILILIVLSVLFTVFRGSRSAILSMVYVAWFAFAAVNPFFLIQRKHVLVVTTLLVGIGFPLFFIALAFRGLHLDQRTFDPMALIQSISFFDMFNEVSARLGELDILSAVLFQLQINDYAEYASFIGTLDCTIKGLLPSFLYTQANYSIDQVFPYIFKGIPLDSPHGEHWTGPGVFIAYCGHYFAPICMAMFMLLCIKFGEKIPAFFKNQQIGYIMRANFAYSFFFPIVSTGAFSFMIPGFLRFSIVLWMIWITSRFSVYSFKIRRNTGALNPMFIHSIRGFRE